jgi:hypothetical protein
MKKENKNCMLGSKSGFKEHQRLIEEARSTYRRENPQRIEGAKVRFDALGVTNTLEIQIINNSRRKRKLAIFPNIIADTKPNPIIKIIYE